jgi:hypothetical protein
MKIFLTAWLWGFAVMVVAAPLAIPTNAPARIELKDQFDVPQRLIFPTTNITFLTIADRRGAEQIAGWVGPVKQRFANRVDIRGLADVSTVPKFLRGMIRQQFQKSLTYPIMLDWSGDVVNAFTYVPNQVTVLVLDERGRILIRLTDVATEPQLQEVYATLDRALAQRQVRGKP